MHSLGRSSSCLAGGGRCQASPASKQLAQPSIIERRSCDVLVLGDSALASAAAYSLGRRGKQVVHVPDMGIQAPKPPAEAIKPLLLLDLDPGIIAMATESSLFFQGLEMQASTPLLWNSKSLELASGQKPVPGSSSTLLVELMDQLGVSAQQAGVKVSRAASEDLITPFPMMRLGPGQAGLLQVDGGVVNARAVKSVLQVLGKRCGVLLRDSLVLKGWQDQGSYVKVRASSRLQPEVEHVFEAERVLLAPGAWGADCLRLWGLDVGELQGRERHAITCAAGSELSRLPLIRYWDLPVLPATKPAAPKTPSPKPASDTKPVEQKEGGQGTDKAPAGVELASGSALEPSPRPFLLFPRLADSTACKLTGVPSSSPRVIGSCWDLKRVGAAPSPTQEPVAGLPGSGEMLESEWGVASDLVKGLSQRVQRDEDEEEEARARDAGQEGTGLGRPQGQVTWDMVTPDGLPLLGWHPSFETGRVLVGCTAGHPGGGLGLPGTLGQSAGDGFQFTPLLAKTAADMLVGSALTSLPLDIDRLAVDRECLHTVLPLLSSLNTWDRLDLMQSGAAHAQRVIAGMSEDELQAIEEEQVVQAVMAKRAGAARTAAP